MVLKRFIPFEASNCQDMDKDQPFIIKIQPPLATLNDERVNAQASRIQDLEVRLAQCTQVLNEATQTIASEIRRRERVQAKLIAAQRLTSFECLVGRLAHDLANALGAMSMGYQLLQVHPDETNVQKIAKNGQLAVRHVQSLMQTVLDSMRCRAGPSTLISPSEWLLEAEALLGYAAGRHIACRLQTAADAWPVQVNEHRLSAALLNLVLNARDAMPDTGILTVSVNNLPAGTQRPETVPGGDFVVFQVTDTGCGMTPDMLAHATAPVFSTKFPGPGAGLGLPMVLSFAQDVGGYLHITSQSGVGTQAAFYLPRSECAMPVTAPATASTRALQTQRQPPGTPPDDQAHGTRLPPSPTMTALKQATWPMHQHLEKSLGIKDRFSDLARYREHLARLLRFHTAAEKAWAMWLTPALSDFAVRRKAALLMHDLRAVGGVPMTGVITLPVVNDTATALGCFYVLEGATLGGQHLLPLVQRRLGLSAGHGASYLASYGPEVGTMWQRFGAAVEAYCTTPEAAARAVAAAQATFTALEDWLCKENPCL